MLKNKNKNKVLIIEDEPALRELLAKKFQKEGISVLSAADGEAGLRMAIEKKPNLIILDVLLPKMDGITMLSELRKDQWGRNVPVFVWTNLNGNENIAKALERGVVGYLIKTDFTLSEITAKIKAYL